MSPAVPASVDWRRHWYPVACLADLDRRRPQAFTLLEQDLVLWWEEAAGRWRAFADVCPHRLVPLSDGRLNERGELECPYHGWSFEGSGRCTRIPQADDESAEAALASPRTACRAYATAEAQGLLFVFAGEAAEAEAVPLPLVPALEEEGEPWLVQDTFRDLPMDVLTLLENVVDVSHVPFTHHRTVGNRANGAPVRAELTAFGPEGFRGSWPEGPRRGALGSQATTFEAPALLFHDLTAPGFARILTVVYAVPIRRGHCRILARFPFRFSSPWPRRLLGLRPRWLQHLANHRVLEDDQVFLHWQERVLEERGRSGAAARAYTLATGADVYVKALHDWVDQFAADPFPGQPLPERLERGALMEREVAHTLQCRSCRGALEGIRRWRPWLAVPLWGSLAGVAWFHTVPALVGGSALALLSLAADRRLADWEQQLLRGDGKPPRNRD
ncbi:MAG: Rieske 2Fe-2S domain-containing protein [Synechococcus sp.]|nr:Rieske 2Fe-2S domain-containing protein [Synechococcus sp.]